MMKSKIILILISFSVLFAPFIAQAEGIPTTLSVYPVIIEKKIDPGKTSEAELMIYNKELLPVAVRLYKMNFEAIDEFGGMGFSNDRGIYSAADWVSLTKTNLALAPGETEKVRVRIKVPREAEPGDHYGVVFVEPVNQVQSSDKSSLGVTGRIGSLLFITVNGDINEKGRVLGATSDGKCNGVACSFSTDKLREWGPVPFEFRFENTGNVRVKVKGKIEIFNLFGKKIAEIPVSEQTVLAGKTRTFKETWLREALFGRYRAKLTIEYGSAVTKDYATTTFWVFPWRAAGSALIIALIFWIILRMRKRKRARNEQKWSANENL